MCNVSFYYYLSLLSSSLATVLSSLTGPICPSLFLSHLPFPSPFPFPPRPAKTGPCIILVVKGEPLGGKGLSYVLHTAINRADFVSWWMWFWWFTHESMASCSHECILLLSCVYNMYQKYAKLLISVFLDSESKCEGAMYWRYSSSLIVTAQCVT